MNTKSVIGLLVCALMLVACGQPLHAEIVEGNISDSVVPLSLPTTVPTTTPTSVPYTPTPATPFPTATNGLILDTNTIIALEAATKAAAVMPGPYSWAEFRHCSSYASEYMRALGFPVNGPFNPGDDTPNAFPWTSVIDQVAWLRQNYPSRVFDAPLIDFLNGNLWGQLPSGSLVYLQTAISHMGYDTYYHVAILIGYHTDGQPQFAEFAGSMKTNASVDRSFWELASFYPILPEGGYDVRPFAGSGIYPPPVLQVTWFNPIP